MFKLNQIFTAPLAGITDKPFRKIIKKFSPDVNMLTEMISSHSISLKNKNCLRNFDTYFDEENLGAQIFGADPVVMAVAAHILEDLGAKWIDINMGCPVPKVASKANAGAFLMKDHKLAGQIISNVVKSVKIPVSIKTRLGWDEQNKNWKDLIKIAENEGATFATIHGRTKTQLFKGNSELEEKPKGFIPIIGNGDIKTKEDIEKVKNLGYDSVMIGRALLGKPWLIAEILEEPVKIDILETILEHLEYTLEYYGERVSIPFFRKYIAWYSAGLKDSSEFRIKINQITELKKLKSEITTFFNCIEDI